MSLARRQLERKAQKKAFDFAAARAAKDEARAVAAESDQLAPGDGDDVLGGAADGFTREVQAPRPTLAQRHRHRVSAISAAAAALLVAGAANDNGELDPAATPADLQRLQLSEDRARLKAIQSVEKKIELKADLLPKYDAWIAGVIEAAEINGQALQDEVLVTCMVWRLDVGDFMEGLKLAAFMMRYGLVLPDHYKRSLPCLVTEEIADASLKLLAGGLPAPFEVLAQVRDLVADSDIHDQVSAKLEKAIGLELVRQADDTESMSAAAGGRRARLEAANAAFNRALELNSSAGVKKDLERVQRELKKEASDGAG